MISGNMEFCFKGNRDYVHGTDIYNELNKYILNQLSIKDVVKVDLSIHKIIRKNISFSLYVNEDSAKDDAAAIFSFDHGGSGYKFVLIENDNDINCRYDYSEEGILNHCEINLAQQKVQINKCTKYSDIEVIVAMNKFLLSSLFADASGKWFFTRYTGVPLELNNKFESLEVHLKHNFNFKLTKSSILIDNQEKGFVFFSLVK